MKCDKCLRDFEPTPQQGNLIERARLGRLKLAILVCPFCKRGVTITEPNPSAQPPLLRCPCAGCTGWVSNILDLRVAEPPPRWGCGECGEVWLDDQALHEAVAEIIARYPHRAGVYRRADGGWTGVALKDEPKDHETTVETAEDREGPGALAKPTRKRPKPRAKPKKRN